MKEGIDIKCVDELKENDLVDMFKKGRIKSFRTQYGDCLFKDGKAFSINGQELQIDVKTIKQLKG